MDVDRHTELIGVEALKNWNTKKMNTHSIFIKS